MVYIQGSLSLQEIVRNMEVTQASITSITTSITITKNAHRICVRMMKIGGIRCRRVVVLYTYPRCGCLLIVNIKAVINFRVVLGELGTLRDRITFAECAVEVGGYWRKISRLVVPRVIITGDEEGASKESRVVTTVAPGNLTAIFTSGGTDERESRGAYWSCNDGACGRGTDSCGTRNGNHGWRCHRYDDRCGGLTDRRRAVETGNVVECLESLSIGRVSLYDLALELCDRALVKIANTKAAIGGWVIR